MRGPAEGAEDEAAADSDDEFDEPRARGIGAAPCE